MKILFICGSLEPGRDGVGDYTRTLACEMISKGEMARILALNDHHLSAEKEEIQELAGSKVSVRRFPESLSLSMNIRRAKLFVQAYDPDWVSLQFVPYAFHKKGLPFKLGRTLSKIGRRKWHIMFHELWIGMDQNAPFKEKFYRFFQKKIIEDLLIQLKPFVTHTQSSIYVAFLKKIGYDTSYLPLFSNIDLHRTELGGRQKKHFLSESKKLATFILFGAIHDGAPVASFTKELAKYCEVHNMYAELKIIGRNGPLTSQWIAAWEAEKLSIDCIGEQPPWRISRELSKASFGITTTPLLLSDKSGSVAAMIHHGLPVICVARQWRPADLDLDLVTRAGVLEYVPGEINCVLENRVAHKSVNVSEIAGQVLDAMKSYC